jgi:biotin carboxylase
MYTVLLVGTTFHTLTNYLLNNGYEYVVLRDIKNAKNPHKKLKRRVICDFSSDKSIYSAVDSLKKSHKIDAVLATYENYIVPMSKIASKLALPSISVESALSCTDKKIMRELFAKSPVKISPEFSEVSSEDEAISFSKNHSFPLILKPTNLAKSLLVSKINTEEELKQVYQKTISKAGDIYQKYGGHKKPKFIIEEFMEGSIHSVDAFIDSKGTPHVLENVVDYQTGHDIGHNDNFHYSRLLPSRLTPEQINSIRETADLGCRALDMKNSPAHIEIILTTNGPRIVEIGARNGGYRERMHKLANGIDITGAMLSLAFGKVPDIKPNKNESCAVLELFPKQPGRFKEINYTKELKNLKSLNYLSIKAKEGEYVGSSSDGYKACAIIILHNKDPEQFQKDLDFINNNVFVITHN